MSTTNKNVISHMIFQTIGTPRKMDKCNGFKLSSHLFSSHGIFKKTRIMYLIIVIQLCDKKLGVQIDTKLMNVHMDSII